MYNTTVQSFIYCFGQSILGKLPNTDIQLGLVVFEKDSIAQYPITTHGSYETTFSISNSHLVFSASSGKYYDCFLMGCTRT